LFLPDKFESYHFSGCRELKYAHAKVENILVLFIQSNDDQEEWFLEAHSSFGFTPHLLDILEPMLKFWPPVSTVNAQFRDTQRRVRCALVAVTRLSIVADLLVLGKKARSV
jgi:hypothetical protein